MSDAERKAQLFAERKLRRRARKEQGIMCVQVEIDEVSVPAALLALGLIAPSEIEDKSAIGRALSKLILRVAIDRERHA